MSSFIQNLDKQVVRGLIATIFPARTISDVVPLTGGLINSNLKIEFKGRYQSVVLRLYRDGPEVCRKEAALYRMIEGKLPAASMLHAEPYGCEGSSSFSILEYIDGITFHTLKKSSKVEAINQAAASVGKVLAKIGQFEFEKPGRLNVGDTSEQLCVGDPFIEGPNPIPRLMDKFLEIPTCERRLGAKLIQRVHEFAWECASNVPDLDQDPRLVHNDFGNRNIVVREEDGKWVVAAILDWELAFSGSPLLDVGHFLRHEKGDRPLCEPFFSKAFVEHGGSLPDNWLEIVKLIDLTGLVESLTHEDLPFDAEEELIGLVKTTLEGVE